MDGFPAGLLIVPRKRRSAKKVNSRELLNVTSGGINYQYGTYKTCSYHPDVWFHAHACSVELSSPAKSARPASKAVTCSHVRSPPYILRSTRLRPE